MTREMQRMKVCSGAFVLTVLLVVSTLALGATAGGASEKAESAGAEAAEEVVAQDVAEPEGDVAASVKPEALVEKTAEELEEIEVANAVCAACHTKEGGSMGIGATEEPVEEAEEADSLEDGEAEAEQPVCLASIHAATGIACTDCHVDAEKLDSIHANLGTKKPASRLRQTKVLDDVCLACHVERVALAELTADVFMEDEKGTQVNPHDLPAGIKDHEELECRDCHAAHKEVAVVTDANGTCLSCHHSGVFECGTCH